MSATTPIPILLLALMLCAVPGRAPAEAWWDEGRSHDRARRAAERGEILPLAEVYERVASQIPGRVLDAELEREDGRWVYELRILEPGGSLLEVDVDATDGRVIERERD